jgi:hypothetical protein
MLAERSVPLVVRTVHDLTFSGLFEAESNLCNMTPCRLVNDTALCFRRVYFVITNIIIIIIVVIIIIITTTTTTSCEVLGAVPVLYPSR